MSEPHFGPKKCVPFDFTSDIKVPKGVRLFYVCGKPVVVPGPEGTTRVYVHPDDVEIVQRANPVRTCRQDDELPF